jgi:hypothetical protein
MRRGRQEKEEEKMVANREWHIASKTNQIRGGVVPGVAHYPMVTHYPCCAMMGQA